MVAAFIPVYGSETGLGVSAHAFPLCFTVEHDVGARKDFFAVPNVADLLDFRLVTNRVLRATPELQVTR